MPAQTKRAKTIIKCIEEGEKALLAAQKVLTAAKELKPEDKTDKEE